MKTWLLVWVAQGFGIGKIRFAPGTFGSMLGLGWFAALLIPSSTVLVVCGILASVPLSVWSSACAEKALNQRDPGSVVIDEIIAIPVCFIGWLGCILWKTGSLPEPGYFFQPAQVGGTIGVFLGFRFFDIVKPWPVRQSQSLPGGWGVTVDDLIAAGYVNLCVLGLWGLNQIMSRRF